LNVAESGAHASDLLEQAQELVRRIRESDEIDFENDWKLVTIYIGLNDLCTTCIESTDGEPDVWIQSVKDGLDYLQDNLPRTFINLVQLLDIGDVIRALADPVLGPVCSSFYRFTCPCVTEFDSITQQYQENLRSLVSSGRYDQSDGFTVVLQPFQSTFEIGGASGLNLSFFVADCFHYSPSGNRELAIALWNNMFERVGEKTSTLTIPQEISCPTDEQPFLQSKFMESSIDEGGGVRGLDRGSHDHEAQRQLQSPRHYYY
jgi:phospholipase B1